MFLLLAFFAILSIYSRETFALFSDTAQNLFSITTGNWEIEPEVNSTSIAALKSAEGFWEQEGGVDRSGVRGDICVTNRGEWETRGLSVVDVVQVKTGSGPFADYVSILVELGEKPVLPAGETACYPYEIQFSAVAGAQYRNTARATITNHAGWLPGDKNCPGPEPCPYGPDTKIGFKLPKQPAVIGEGGAAGKAAQGPTPTLAPDDGQIEAPVASPEPSTTPAAEAETETPPASAPTATPTATATAEPTPTFEPPREQLPTPTLAPPDDFAPTGCTYSAEFWLWNPRDWPVGELELGGLDYSQEQALAILGAPVEADETFPLVQPLIAARLNVEQGANAAGVAGMIEAADEWLAAHPPGSHPPKPDRLAAQDLAEQLEDFNEGQSGPPRCADGDLRPTPTPAPEDTAAPGLPQVPTATNTPEPSPTTTEAPPDPTTAPSETPPPSATPTFTETPQPTPTAAEELPTQTPLPTETPLPTDTPAPADHEEPGPGETPTSSGG
jgi:type VI secretion system secreted protein VgrG